MGCREQLRHGAFLQKYGEKPYAYEEQLDEIAKKMRFRGIIDRIDLYEDAENVYVKVVDYKTGNVKLSLEEVYFGLQLQLILYLDSALQSEQKKHPGKDVQPAGMLYFYVQDPQLEVTGTEDEIEYEQKLLAEYACDGYVNESPEILEKLDSILGANGELNTQSASRCYPVKIKKDGDFAATTKVLSSTQWKKLMEHVKTVIHENGTSILAGNIDIAPYRLKEKRGCDYCGMKDICGLERTDVKKVERNLEEIDIKKILLKMREEESDNEMDE